MSIPSIPQTELAAALGVTPSVVTRCKARGMPTHSVEAARQWRQQHVRPRVLPAPIRSAAAVRPAPAGACPGGADDGASRAALATAMRLGRAALDLLDAGATIAAVEPELRRALRAVPPHLRGSVALPLAVWDALTSDVRMALGIDIAESPGTDAQPSIAEAETGGAVWYEVAAGELTATGGGAT